MEMYCDCLVGWKLSKIVDSDRGARRLFFNGYGKALLCSVRERDDATLEMSDIVKVCGDFTAPSSTQASTQRAVA